METGITYKLPREFYVLQINGRITLTHRRFQDALRAGLLASVMALSCALDPDQNPMAPPINNQADQNKTTQWPLRFHQLMSLIVIALCVAS